ncbi:MAG: Ig-like domain-containing protein [Chloroflexota bacterium]|nr:Ig-like domain-containing protein [Chloroflexota bacterium]
MKRLNLYKIVALVTLLSLLLGACRTSIPSPTLPPYTPPPPGAIPAVVVQRTPERGEELLPDGAIELVFDRPMDRTSVETAFQVSPEVAGRLDWADERTVRFKPARDLKRDAEYYVTVGAEAQASDGNPLDGAYRFRFRTVGYLEVAQIIPAPDTEDVETGSSITVIFNRPVVPLTAVSDPGYTDLPQPVTFDPSIEGSGEWLNTSIYVFTPAEPLAGGATYEARIAAGLADTTGGVLAEDYEWSFSTQPPQVVWVSPTEGAELVGVDTALQVIFNMEVDCGSATEAFSLRAGLRPVSGDLECVGERLVFTPTERLAFDATYEARVDAGVWSFSSSEGGYGEGMRDAYEWRFATVPLPRIVGTRPYDGQQDAWPYTDFEIIFNAPVDPATVMPNLEMTPPLSPTLVYTYFRHWDNTFVLDFDAQPSTDYEVRIGPNVADPYGNTTGQEMTVRFRTAPLEPAAWLTILGQIGTYDAHQPARIVAGYLNTDRLDLSLHQLDVSEFFRARQDWWDYHPSGSPIREWSASVAAPLDETQYAALDLVEGGGRLAPGIYLLEMRASGVEYDRWGHRKLLIVSDYNLTIKAVPMDGGYERKGEMWVWATDLATGKPAAGLALTAQDADGKALGTATTDTDGLARFTGTSRSGDIYVLAQEPFLLGGTGWDWGAGISPWDFGLEPSYGESAHRAHVYTDRPIYRPGQTVYFRGILRAEDDVHYSLPRRAEVGVSIYDGVGEEIYNEQLPLDEFGAFHGELALAEGAPLGEYSIQVVFGDEAFYSGFQVAAYRPPEFEVLVTPREAELVSGQATQATVEVRYFFGGPVADVNVEWNLLSAPYRFEPPQLGRYDFTDEDDPWVCRWCWWWEPPAPGVVLSGAGRTDADGQLTIALPTEVMTGGQRLTVEATVYGKDGQTISGRDDVVVHKGEFYVGLAPRQYVGEVGEKLAVDVVTVDWAGERLPDQSLDAEVYRREWVNTFVENELGGGNWEWEAVDTLVYTGTLTTNSNAEAVATFMPQEGGSYRVVVSASAPVEGYRGKGRSSTWVWVSGSEYISWRRENNDRVTLVSDKSTYVPGETAEILIPSPFAGEQWAWVTVERGGVLQQEVLRLESNSTVYRLPITVDHAPNIYVSAVVVKGPDSTEQVATHKVGYVMLTVEPVEQELTITLTPNLDQAETGQSWQAEPGDIVSFDVRATDVSGEPVQAAFSLDLVDKAVLSLKPRPEDAILEAFYGRRGLGVTTASGLVISVNRLLLEQLEEMEGSLAAQGLGVGGGGVEVEEEVATEAPAAPMPTDAASDEGRMFKGAAALPPGVELREEFEDTAFWDGAIVTDLAGRATVEVELPDNLTTWVFRGVGITADTEVGEETVDLLVTKPLLVRPVTPRFFVVGDRVQLAALVSNNTDKALDVEITLHAEGVQISESAAQQVSVSSGGEVKVTWWVKVEDVEVVDVAMSAVAGEYSDAARPRLTTGPDGTLLVHRYTAPEIVGTGGQLVGEDVRTEVVALPPKYDDRQGELSIRLDPSLAAGMTDGLDYLEHFPYECTEQTVSRFLPNVLTYQALQELEIRDQRLERKLPDLVEQGLGKLYLQQHGDGGWGWWYEGESNPYLTAYVVFALIEAREAGFEVRADVVGRGLDYLENTLVSAREIQSYREANRQAFLLYVMAEAGQTRRVSEYTGDLYDRREKLSHYGRAFLALTLALVDENDSRISTLLSDLQNAAILSATGAHWEEADYDWWAMNTDTRSTAIILDALVRLSPSSSQGEGGGLIPNVVRWLMVARRDGIWETTQETAWALIAFTDWMVVTGELEGAYDYELRLNDDVLVEGSVTPDTVGEPVQLRVDVAEMLAGVGNRLAIGRGPGEGRLYYTAHLEVYLPVEEIEPLDRGIIVSRRYTDPACSEGVKCPEVNEAAVGDVVQVRLTVIAPHDLYYVVVEDPLPAGAEAIDTSLATTSELVQEPGLYRETEDDLWYGFYRWWWRWYSRSEMRDDKVVLFADYLPAGTYEYTYSFRATQPGEYRVIPTAANEFYFPEVFGRGDGRLFTVTGAE